MASPAVTRADLGPIDPDRAIRYEVALEVLAAAVGWVAGEIAKEEAQEHPDWARVDDLKAKKAAYSRRRLDLKLDDAAAVEDVIAQVGALVRSWYGPAPIHA